MHRLLLWLTNTFNESKWEVIKHIISRYIFRIHLSIYSATSSPAVADTLLLISKDLYGFFKSESFSQLSDQDLFQRDIELCTEFLRIVANSADLQCLEAGFTQISSDPILLAGISAASTAPQSSHGKRKGSRGVTPVSSVSFESMSMLLQSAEFISGCLKEYSTVKENRRRMIHLDSVNVMAMGLQKLILLRDFMEAKFSRTSTHVFSLAVRTATGPSSHENDPLYQSISSQLILMEKNAIQLLSAFRNFALDDVGREQLLISNIFPLLCRVIKTGTAISASGVSDKDSDDNKASELLLSSVRVTAKLSLFEDFRDQVNSSKPPIHLASLVGILTTEGKLMAKVMNGDESINWPSWHTWPLLSRTAFTLGNFTTTNDSNRFCTMQ